jgi:hypothetical protein
MFVDGSSLPPELSSGHHDWPALGELVKETRSPRRVSPNVKGRTSAECPIGPNLGHEVPSPSSFRRPSQNPPSMPMLGRVSALLLVKRRPPRSGDQEMPSRSRATLDPGEWTVDGVSIGSHALIRASAEVDGTVEARLALHVDGLQGPLGARTHPPLLGQALVRGRAQGERTQLLLGTDEGRVLIGERHPLCAKRERHARVGAGGARDYSRRAPPSAAGCGEPGTSFGARGTSAGFLGFASDGARLGLCRSVPLRNKKGRGRSIPGR